jgi:mannose-1-phosphate guanylyltransferase
MLHALIMAGGSGTRFWPASRAGQPKQLLRLVGDQSMLQATVRRLDRLIPPERILILTSQRLVDSVSEQLPQLAAEAVVGEPHKRDTAPCIGLAAGWLARRDPDAIMVVMPADHVIEPVEQFHRAIEHASQLVQERPERLVTFGIRPSYPAESFGYIERGDLLQSPRVNSETPPTHAVRQFREKPRAEVARQYLEAGNFLWNSGIFVWKARTIRSALARLEPEMFRHLETIVEAWETPRFSDVFAREFAAIDGRSIDYAVMERAEEVVVVEAPFTWDDVGSWQAIARLGGSDQAGNTIQGKHLGMDTTGTIVRGDKDHLIVTLGLRDCLIVWTPDATLVADKHNEEAVRQVVELLRERGWDEYL